MKKIIIVLTVLCCAFVVFAEGKNSIDCKVSPFSALYKTSGIYKETKTTNGVGIDVAYQRFFVKGLFIEGGLGGNYMKMDGKNFTSIMAFTGVGYKCTLNKFFTTLHVDFAADLAKTNGAFTKSFGIKFGTGAGWNLSDLISLSLTCDATITYFPGAERVGVFYRIQPMAGVAFTF